MFIHASAAGSGDNVMICVTFTEEAESGVNAVTSTIRMDEDMCRLLHSQLDKLLLDITFEHHGIEPGAMGDAADEVAYEKREDEYLARFADEPF